MMKNIRVVLIETSHPGNIGAVARAMKNMDLSELVLVSPERYPSNEATWRAAGAVDVLERARVVSSLDEALGGCQLVVGASARERRLVWPVVAPPECAELVWQAAVTGQVALVFGREDRGLSNDELQRCNYHVHIPANPEYSALNLAMAVQVISYELRLRQLKDAGGEAQRQCVSVTNPRDDGWDFEPAANEEVERFFEHLESTLVQIGFHDPENPRQLMTRLRRLFQRSWMDKMEVNILRGILTSVQQRTRPDEFRSSFDSPAKGE